MANKNVAETVKLKRTSKYAELKKKGLCPMCGGKREDKAYVLCVMCRKYGRASYYRKLSKMSPEELSETYEHRRETVKKLKASRRAQGLCVQCGAVSPIHWLCEVCYDKRTGHGYSENA